MGSKRWERRAVGSQAPEYTDGWRKEWVEAGPGVSNRSQQSVHKALLHEKKVRRSL